jgi:hypothetical protein
MKNQENNTLLSSVVGKNLGMNDKVKDDLYCCWLIFRHSSVIFQPRCNNIIGCAMAQLYIQNSSSQLQTVPQQMGRLQFYFYFSIKHILFMFIGNFLSRFCWARLVMSICSKSKKQFVLTLIRNMILKLNTMILC